MKTDQKIIIVGGGITGLAAAYRLEQIAPQAQVTLLEASGHIGGKLFTEQLDGFRVEAGADSFLSRKPRGVGLCEELGIGGDLVGRKPENRQTFVKRHGQLHNLPEGLSGMVPTNIDALAKSSLVSAAGRARFAQEKTIPARVGDDDESLASFMTRRMGAEIYQQLIEPLMSGIYAGDGTKLSLLATFPQLREIEKEYGSLLVGLTQNKGGTPAAKYPPFTSLSGGMGDLPQTVLSHLQTTHVLLNSAVKAIVRQGKQYKLTLANGQSETADKVILTTPAWVTAQLTEKLDPDLAQSHAEIPHASSVTLTLGYNRAEIEHPINGYGYVIPRIENTEVLACTWTSSKWANRAPDDKVALRLFLGKYGRRPVVNDSDEEILALAQNELRETLGISAKPTFNRLYRWHNGMPQYTLGHLDRVTAIEERIAALDGLAVAGAPYRGVGIPDCIRAGEQAAEQLTLHN